MAFTYCYKLLKIMDITNTAEQEPRHGYNVLVKHTTLHQDFWTRGFLMGEVWTVMTWKGKVEVPKNFIDEWMPLPTRE